jgi:RNA polymerase sigma-70 factor, ECF subfamily
LNSPGIRELRPVGGASTAGKAGTGSGEHRVLYCVVPQELAPKLHDYLRRHWRDEPWVRVVVEQRASSRRQADRRRRAVEAPREDRRAIRNPEGRRVSDRRATTLTMDAPPLPRRARAHASQLTFIERFEPDAQTQADESTNRLIVELQGGSASAMAELYLRYFDSVYGYARIALRDAHEAEDLTQQVFTNALQALPKYEIRRSVPFRAWLFRITRNAVIDALRRRSRLELHDPGRIGLRREQATSPGADTMLSWLSDSDLAMFIERLPAAQREVLVLHYMLDLKSEEIASVIGRTPKAVRNLQARALKTLEERLVAIGRGPLATRRAPMLTRLKPLPVMSARRFALASSTPGALYGRRAG